MQSIIQDSDNERDQLRRELQRAQALLSQASLSGVGGLASTTSGSRPVSLASTAEGDVSAHSVGGGLGLDCILQQQPATTTSGAADEQPNLSEKNQEEIEEQQQEDGRCQFITASH